MRKLYVFLVALFAGYAVSAQTANFYIFSSSTGASLDPMTGSTTLVNASSDDGTSTLQNIGFTFQYEGTNYTQYSINVNGLLKFGGLLITDQYSNSVTSTENRPKLMPCWDDLHTGATAGGGKVHTVLTGTAPNRIRIIEWYVTIPRSTSGNANARFQCWLYEGTNVIEFRYGASANSTTSASYGLGGVVETNYLSITTSAGGGTASSSSAVNNNTTWPGQGTVYTFTPPVISPCAVPADQPTAFTAGTITSTSIPASFTAAASTPAGYLVVRSIGAFTGSPVNGTLYSAGNTIGNGTVVQSSGATSFTSSSLTSNTTYTFTVYSYNSGNCSGGPVYNTSSPLTATATTCPSTPSILGQRNETSTGFTVLWSSLKGGGALNPLPYTLEVATDNAFANPVAGSPFSMTDTTTNQITMAHTVTGLTPGTRYYARVRVSSGCNTANSSVATLATECEAITSLPFTEPFSASVPCWSTAVVSGSSNWSVGTTSNDISSPKAGTHFAYKSYSTSTANLYSLPFNLSAYGTSTVRLNFWFYRYSATVAADEIRFYVNTSKSTTGATLLLTLKPRTSEAPTVPSAGWYNYTADIPTSFNSAGNIYFIVQGTTTAGFSSYDIAIDEFTVELAPTTPCAAPADQAGNLTFGTPGVTSQPGSFTAAASAPTGYLVVRSTGALTGTPVNGTLYANGAVLGNGVVVQSGASTSFTATGLSGNTNYTFTVFAYNHTACLGGPAYNTTSPLTGESATCPSTPSGLKAEAITPDQFVILWNSSKGGGATGPIDYTIEITTDAAYANPIPGSPITFTDSTTTSATLRYLVTGLNAATTYFYRIKASGCNTTFATGSIATGTGTPPDCSTGEVITECTAVTTAFTSGSGAWSMAGSYPVSSMGYATPGKEAVYRFTPTTTGVYYLEVTSVSGSNYVDYFYKPASSGCSNTGWIGIDDGNSSGKNAIGLLQAGVEYYILLDLESTSTPPTHTFRICPATTAAPATLNTCISTITLPGTVPAYSPKKEYVIDAAGNLIAALDFSTVSNSPGTVSVSYYVNGNALRKDGNNREYLDRNFTITTSNTPNSPVEVTLFFLNSELQKLIDDPNDGIADVASISDLRITKTSEPCSQSNAVSSGGVFIAPVATGALNANVSYVRLQTSSFSTFYLHGGVSILPANMLTFSGTRKGNANDLKWIVAQETDVKVYVVERSTDGRNWNAVGSVNSLGTTTQQRTYTFTDNNLTGLKQLYRLRQVDVNGSARMSNIISITGVKPLVLSLAGLFPNPAASKLNLLVDAPGRDNLTIVVTDAVGRVVKMQKAPVDAGANTLQVDVAGMAKGTYMLKVTGDNSQHAVMSKFVKE